MRLVIELNDADIKQSIETQMSAIIAREVGARMQALADNIITTKMERVTPDVVDKLVESAAMTLLSNSLGTSEYQRRARLEQLIASKMTDIIRGSLK